MQQSKILQRSENKTRKLFAMEIQPACKKTKKQTEAGCVGLQEKKLFKKLYQEGNKWTNDAYAGQGLIESARCRG